MNDIIENISFPQEWDVLKMRQGFSFGKGLSITKDDLVEDGIPVISYGQVHAKENTGTGLSDELYRYIPESFLKTGKSCLVHKNDFIFADTSEDYAGVGNCVFIDNNDTIFAGYHSIIARPTSNTLYPKYLAYLFLTDLWRDQIRANVMGIKVFSITQQLLRDTYICVPPVSEQKRIVQLLDSSCAKLDKIIANLERQIDLLQKYKKSLIKETVTKGLDRSAPMRDSGIYWIGTIPEHWKINRLRYIAKLYSGATPSKAVDDYWSGDIPWVSSLEVKTDVIYDTSLHITEAAIHSCSTKLMPPGTLVMVVRSGILQHDLPVALLGKEATINQDIKAFECTKDVDPAFLRYFIEGHNDALINLLVKDKTTVESIDNDLLLSLKVALPPYKEQRDIVDALDHKCEKFKKIFDLKTRQLAELTAIKNSLIYEYVTGKKRIKEVV